MSPRWMAYPRPLRRLDGLPAASELFRGSSQRLRTYPGSGSGAITKLLSSCDFSSKRQTVHTTFYACLAPGGLWGPVLSTSAPGTTSLSCLMPSRLCRFLSKQSSLRIFFLLCFLPVLCVMKTFSGTCLTNLAAPRSLSPDGQLAACFGM